MLPGSSASAGASPAWQLPVELLLHFLMAADTSSRISAGHVCHVWREAALGELRLWDTFSCTNFRNKHHTDVMFALLQAMLLRSCSLPFDLRIPYYNDGNDFEYRDRILGLDSFDIRRLAAYHGPAGIFSLLNPSRQPLPALVCLEHGPHEGLEMREEFGPRCLPNLRRLVAPHFCFPENGSPFLSLTSITSMSAHTDFFGVCPRLRTLEITDMHPDTLFPSPPAPPSLQTIIVRCERLRAQGLVNFMYDWWGIRIRRFVIYELNSLGGVLPLFLASHAQPVELRLTALVHAVTLAALPDDGTARSSNDGAQIIWTIHHSPPWPSYFLGGVEKPASDRVRSLSISFVRLGVLLRAQLHLPGLEKIEIILSGTRPTEADGLPVLSGAELSLRAPGLGRVAFTFDDDYAHSLSECLENCQGALATLHESFRVLIIYDAELLDSVVASRQIERECAGFAHLAREYTIVSRGSRIGLSLL